MKPRHTSFLTVSLLILIGLITYIAALPQVLAKAEDNQYVFRRSWGEVADRLDRPSEFTIGPDGTIYVVDYQRILEISPQERTFNNWSALEIGHNGTNGSQGIAVDINKNVYIVDTNNHRILKYGPDRTLVAEWGAEGNNPGEFYYPSGIVLDNKGNVYVSDRGNHRIQRFARDGTFSSQWGTYGSGAGQFDHPSSIAIGNGNRIYVNDSGNRRIQIFTTSGTYLGAWNDITAYGIAADNRGNVYTTENNKILKFSSGSYVTYWVSAGAFRLAVDANGNVYALGNNRIRRFSASGEYSTEWGRAGYEGEQLGGSPRSIALDDTRNLVFSTVAGTAYSSGSVRKFTRSGSLIGHWELNANYITVDNNGDIYLTRTNADVHKYNNSGDFLLHWGGFGYGTGQFQSSTGITIDNNNSVFVADGVTGNVQKFTASGSYLTQWYGSGHGLFAIPTDIAVDHNGSVFVVERGSNRIQKFNNDGAYLTHWGSEGSNPGQFSWPEGIYVDSSGNVYIADTENSRIQKFTNTGAFLTQWGSQGHSHESLYLPKDVAVNSSGAVYVADSGNHRIQVFTPQHPAPHPLSGLILNGSFEGSALLEEWTFGGELSVSRSDHASHGNYAIKLGQAVPQTEQDLRQAWSHQTIYIEPTWERPTLTFKYNMFVNDIIDYSDFFVAIQDGVGLNHLAAAWRDGYQPCTPNVAPAPGTNLGWRDASYDLSAYKGQHIRLVFANRNLWPGSWGIWTHVDDVRVLDAGPPPPLPSDDDLAFLPAISYEACDPVPARALFNSHLQQRETP